MFRATPARRLLTSTLLVAACTNPGTRPVGPVDDGPHEHPDVETDTDLPDTRRPLCREPAFGPEVAEDLLPWIHSIYGGSNRFYGNARWVELEALGEIGLGAEPIDEVTNRIERGYHRLRLGRLDDAIADLQTALDIVKREVPTDRAFAKWADRCSQLLATTWMRKAELDNCVSDGTGAACLVPFSEEAEHKLTEGMTTAISLLAEALDKGMEHELVPLWLLNVANMALGTFPDGVPEPWAMPADSLRAEASLPAWANIAPAIGLKEPGLAGSAATEDFDGDGLIDLLLSSQQPDAGMRLYLNQGDGGFCEASLQSGVSASVGHLGFSTADYDNDGDVDVFAPRGAWNGSDGVVRPSLLQNDGTGRFTDVAVAAGVADTFGPSQVSVWSDVDGDGWLDVFVGREQAGSDPHPYSTSSLYMNQGDGTFVDTAATAGLLVDTYVKGANFGDFDDDGDPDLYVSAWGDDNRLFRNEGGGLFTDVTEQHGVAEPREAFGSWFFDYDQDGDLDIFAAAYPIVAPGSGPLEEDYGRAAEPFVGDVLELERGNETAKLYRNNGGTFEDVTVAVGLDDIHATMGLNFGDLDMDGWPDPYLSTGAPDFDALEPNTAYRNVGGSHFLDVTSSIGVGHLQKGHGVGFGDIDNDGDEDLLVDIGGAFPGDNFPNAMFLNPTTGQHGLTLRLEGVTTNRQAIGARVRVVTPTRTFHHVVGTGGSFGNNSVQVEAGLGPETTIQRVEIDWPWAETEVIEGVVVDHVVAIRQGEGVVTSVPFGPIAMHMPDHGH